MYLALDLLKASVNDMQVYRPATTPIRGKVLDWLQSHSFRSCASPPQSRSEEVVLKKMVGTAVICTVRLAGTTYFFIKYKWK